MQMTHLSIKAHTHSPLKQDQMKATGDSTDFLQNNRNKRQ